MKPLVLLSFSLAFLMQGFADDSSAPAPSEQPNIQQNGGDQAIGNDASTTQPSQPANVEKNSGNQVMTGNSFATEPSEQQPEVSMSMEFEEAEWCLSPYHEFHASIRHNEANGIGYKDGYTTFEVFEIFDDFGSDFMPFFDLRGHVFNNGRLAGNVGIGERTLLESMNHTFGSYLYYDARSVGHGLTVNQLSPGIELVGERMEYRINGYFPLGKRKSHEYGFKFDKFSGNSIILKDKQLQAMMGGDAEVGIHIPQSTIYDVYAAAGPYYFHSSNAQSWGGKVRLLGRYKEYVTLEVTYSYDRLFRNVVQGSLALTVPFGGQLQRCGTCCPQTDNLLLSRAAFAPSRFEIPVVKRVRRSEKAINPATGQPWVVWFVNNTSHSAGTFESPFPTLLQAQNTSSQSQMIYVFPGDGTTKGMNAGITLQDGQSFFGSGIKQQFATTKGTMTIPAMSSRYPSLTTGMGNVVTIRNGNVVSGFNVSSAVPNATGIGSIATVNGATIINNIVTTTTTSTGAIRVTGFGPVNISNNQVTGPATTSSALFGIKVLAQGEIMSGMISNNLTSGFGAAIVFDSTIANPGSYDMIIQGNTVTGYGNQGISPVMVGTSSISVIGNTVTTNFNLSSSAIVVIDDPSTISGRFIIADNQVVVGALSNFSGFQFFSNNPAAWNLSALVTNNSVQGVNSTFKGYNFTVAATDTLCLTLDNNTYANSAAGSTGFNFSTTGTGVINIDSIQGNVGGPVSSTGNVNLVAPGTCGN